MQSKQPVWKHVASIGDVDPIAYGGGFVYEDTTGMYPPEVAYFDPAPDEVWHKTEGKTPLTVYRFILEPKPENEWWYDKLGEIAAFTGRTTEDLQKDAKSTIVVQANLYRDIIAYYGVTEFDQYPATMTEEEAYHKYADEMKGTSEYI